MTTLQHASPARHTAEERREAILDAAIVEFALCGLHGTATEAIARRVGISQPYIFRLFSTKKELFLAAVERVYDRVTAAFMDAAAGASGDILAAMGRAYAELVLGRSELFLLLQGFAASSDDDVRAVARRRYAELYEAVADVSGADVQALRQFFAYGMLCTVATAIDLPLLLEGKICKDVLDGQGEGTV